MPFFEHLIKRFMLVKLRRDNYQKTKKTRSYSNTILVYLTQQSAYVIPAGTN
jgi:hypothetical protein